MIHLQEVVAASRSKLTALVVLLDQ